MESIIQYLGKEFENQFFMKREDLIPYSFGGNKARKCKLFFEEIDKGNYDCVVTYGSSHSNHCRVVANMAAARKMNCYIISPETDDVETYNKKFMRLFEANIIIVSVDKVSEEIDVLMNELRKNGKNPFFIPGGGHGNIGTHAYVGCYEEIKEYERKTGIVFDYIFFASGTGTTQAGLICGKLNSNDDRKIVGISIARKNPRGREIVIESVKEYIKDANSEEVKNSTIFLDEYVCEGYSSVTTDIIDMIKYIMIKYGIATDTTYTGKALWGMSQYLKKESVRDKNILFIHTGGTPLFFDDLNNGIS